MACSSDDKKAAPVAAKGALRLPESIVINKKHPLAKYLELAGYRLTEKGEGKLDVRLGVVNHSDADITDLEIAVTLRPNTGKEDEPPVCSFKTKVPAIGPQEIKDVTVQVPTKLRVYEMPDWQFLRGEFEILAPAP